MVCVIYMRYTSSVVNTQYAVYVCYYMGDICSIMQYSIVITKDVYHILHLYLYL